MRKAYLNLLKVKRLITVNRSQPRQQIHKYVSGCQLYVLLPNLSTHN